MTTDPDPWNRSSRQAPPDTAEVAADLVFSLNRSAIWACSRGEPAVMIGRPPPPAAPKSGPAMRPAVPPKVAGQDTACRVMERASLTLRRPETQLKCQSPSNQGSLEGGCWLTGWSTSVMMVPPAGSPIRPMMRLREGETFEKNLDAASRAGTVTIPDSSHATPILLHGGCPPAPSCLLVCHSTRPRPRWPAERSRGL
jgi:hypothetical protein